MTTITRDVAAAAAERRQNVRQRADRPSQRRSAEPAGSRASVRAALAGVQLRDAAGDGSVLEFTGHASVTERGYEMWDWYGPYTEVISADAFSETLARADLDVPLVLGHDQLRRIARTTTGTLDLSIDDTGLLVVARLDPADVDVAYIAPKLRSGLVDEMSFAFRIESGVWSPDWTQYRIERVDMHRGDTAIVGYGANPATDAGLRQQARSDSSRARALLELALAGD
ncbi:HK97 family phage prohead protease [Micromonospora sp. NPDC051196]|uniref:HK97 family phage prohead protease n=1 Tax=Micromonospora sp. NPDC051196 TaxID=3155281 RepID=UPI003438B2A0